MKYVLITGAAGGMGRAAARHFAARGYTVFALDRRPVEAEENILPVVADITDPADIAAAAAAVGRVTNTLFAVLHFAGMYTLDSLVEIDEDVLERILRVNFLGACLVNRALVPYLSEGSRIIMTTSELAPLDPLPFTGLYAVTKSALDKYAFSLRMELQLLGISVSVLRAGAVKTDMLGASTKALDDFCLETKLYKCNAERFRHIVDSVEAKCVPPEKIAEKMLKIAETKHPRFAYAVNRNPYLRLLHLLPRGLQCRIIRRVLRP